MTALGRPIPDKYAQRYPDDLPAVAAALRAGLSGASETVSKYEAALARFFDARFAVALSSGGAALSVALAALGVGVGSQVALTPVPPLCTAFPVIDAGAEPVFIDTAADHFGADPARLRENWPAGVTVVVDTPMWGYPTPARDLREVAHKNGARLVLDLAHAHGTRLDGRPLSTFADLACFSTHERKPLATGEGGFILTDDQDLARRCRSYSRFGDLNGTDFGLNYKPGALPAALGTSRLAHLPAQLAARKRNADRLFSQLAHPRVRPAPVVPGGEPNYYAALVRLAFADNRKFIDDMAAAGVPSDIARYGCKPLYEWPALATCRRSCPNAEALLASTTTIPVHPNVTDAEIDAVAALINDYPF